MFPYRNTEIMLPCPTSPLRILIVFDMIDAERWVMKILEKGERADTLYGIQTEYITEEMIEALRNGQRLYTDVQGEYALVIKYKAVTERG